MLLQTLNGLVIDSSIYQLPDHLCLQRHHVAEKYARATCLNLMVGQDLSFCASTLGHLKAINFPFGTNEKLMALDVPKLQHCKAKGVLLYFFGGGEG